MRTWGLLTIAVLIYAASVAGSAFALPDGPVPVHYGAGGVADRFGSPAEAVVGNVVVGVLMAVLGYGMQALARRAPMRAMNVPHKDYWGLPEHVPQVRRMLAEDLADLMVIVLLMVSTIPPASAWAAHQDPPAIPAWAFWLGLVAFMGVIGHRLLVVVRHRYTPPTG